MKTFSKLSLLHVLLWAGYFTVIELSQHDRSFFEVILFFMFLYFSYLLSERVCESTSSALKSTICSSFLFLATKISMLSFALLLCLPYLGEVFTQYYTN
ncbi:hypothetical protein SAMN04488137_1060 [Fictibacillus solisalsi]|uniref:Uncharacterized protein n=1 Tax=Fictibacillus solisalsi TaxID=459525 RepID=A0A1G9UPJ2_9BACL|nr:hypothetical protein SAMN04488137_1060 [Fictibacillus solisalsi]